ncbi:hypothetical protein FOMA001_g16338 [Fusarium oxysporum f. sp. matthiolae]|nr:hypothetical protein FOMA001_g16338 [Fusarium oxysporum f. sp. matthiolae]
MRLRQTLLKIVVYDMCTTFKAILAEKAFLEPLQSMNSRSQAGRAFWYQSSCLGA